ncbi:MAG TPA: DEAD/DEAH box helicase, partial [bacterium]|nr:DEAD/DEAH box helicase [bacterium]
MGINIKSPLPIDRHLPEIESALASAPALILQATPGSGKTTRVPPYLLEKDYCPEGGQILVLVPRRLAAKMAALRVAEERGEAVGGTVGYQFRFENQSGSKTRLKFLTEGMLLRYLVQDPLLSRSSLVVLDEFHERHLHSDVALGYLRRLQATDRPDLKLLVMSATLETEGLSSFLGGAPILRFEAPAYPVTIEYQPSDAAKPLERKIKEAVAGVLAAKGGAIAPSYGENRDLVARGFSPVPPTGDILVFLPGMGEILRSADALRQAFGGEVRILPLHGELPKEEQAKVFAPADRRKVILATNVAETSLTIEGVTTVIDSG